MPQIPRQLTTALDKCDYNIHYCLLKFDPPEKCTLGLGSNSKQCPIAVHHKCQRSWEQYAHISEEDQSEEIFVMVPSKLPNMV